MCEICSTFNPLAEPWLHDGSLGDGVAVQANLVTSASLADDATSTAVYADSPKLPTYSNSKIADLLLHGSWNTHGGDTWHQDIDLDTAPNRPIYVDYSAVNAAGKWFVQQALDAWTAATGIRFAQATATNNAQIVFDDERSGANTSTTAWTTGEIVKSTINISKTWIVGDEYTHDAYSLRTFIHEIGHALGLGHPADYGSTTNDGDDFTTDATFANDSWQATVMSYFSQSENTLVDASHAYVLTPQVADIMAIRELYGATGGLRTGRTTYGEGSTAGDYYDLLEENWKTMSFTIVDDGGVDTIDFSTTARDQEVDLNPGAYSSVGNRTGNMGIAIGTLIENFRSGSGDDDILGNRAANRLEGGGGNDTINGGGAADKLLGQGGNDILLGGSGNDTLFGWKGNDRLKGGSGNDGLYGSDGADRLMGGDGDDRMNGEVGRDSLYGDDGDDRLDGGAHNDFLDGGAHNDRLFGNRGDDWIKGGAGNDFLHGGIGNDVLIGGTGRDTFRFRPGLDRDVIRDYEDGVDRIDLTGFGLSGLADVKSAARKISDGLVLDFGDGDSLVIRGYAVGEMSLSDFLLDG